MRALTIAGADPSGGGGLQRDLTSFAALGVEGLGVLASLTAQNTTGVSETLTVPGAFVARQIDALLADLPPAATKTGLLLSVDVVEVIARTASRLGPLVVDPVLITTAGQALVDADVQEAIRRQLLPVTTLVTPNLAEAAALVGFPVVDRPSMHAAAQALLGYGAASVLVKGGHLDGAPIDLLVSPTGVEEFVEPRIQVPDVRGTGCALSAAIVAGLVQGRSMSAAVAQARGFVRAGLAAAAPAGQGAWHLGRPG